MPVLTVVPEVVSAAAGELSGIGSTLVEANTLAAAPTLGVVAPAGDSVSARVAELFGGHAQSYQSVSAQAAAFHQDFVDTFSSSSAAYREADAAGASPLGKGRAAGLQLLTARQHQPTALATAESRLWRPGMAGGLSHGIRSGVPLLNGLGSNVGNQLGTELSGIFRRGTAQGLFPLLHHFIDNQVNYLKLILSSLEDFVKDELKAIAGLPAAFEQAVKDLASGNAKGAMNDIAKGFLNFIVTGLNWDQLPAHKIPGYDGLWYDSVWYGPMADLWHLTQIPAQRMQNLADFLKLHGLGKGAQYLADHLEAFSKGWEFHVAAGEGGLTMGRLAAATFDILGAPILAMQSFEDSIQTGVNALLAGHPLKAMLDLAKTPFKMTDAFLFGQGELPLFWGVADSGVENRFTVHLGGLFAPLDYLWWEKNDALGMWTGFGTQGVQTGGLFAALVSMLPPQLQAPFHSLGEFIYGLVALLTGRPAFDG